MILLENYAGEHGVVLSFVNEINTMYIDGSNTMFKDDKFEDYKISTLYAKVVYDYAKQITLIIEDINEFYRELITSLINIKGKISLDNEVIETIKSVIYFKIINYSFFFKHEKFSKEEECRIAFIVGDDSDEIIKYRKRGNEMIPYIEVEFRKESLSKVSYI